MPKILIIETCIVNFGDDRGGVVESVGATVEVNKDTARDLTLANRALYLNKTDDPDKHGRNTAPDAMVKAAAREAKAPKEAIAPDA